MLSKNLRLLATPALTTAVVTTVLPVWALDVDQPLSIGGTLAATGQCQSVSTRLPAEGGGAALNRLDDECRGGLPIQFEISYHPDDANEFFVKLGFATEDGLNQVSPWNLTPWAADMAGDVQRINGRDRDYLLTAYYKYTWTFRNESTLGASIGIIDATDYIDGNEYANDEYTQFMNEVFVNSGSYNLGSYDAGAVLAWEHGEWTLTGLGMNVGENDTGDNYNFWGLEVGYNPRTTLGSGNYRLLATGTSTAFSDLAGRKQERLLGYGLSFDQAFGETVGAFLRVSWQQENAAVDYRSLYSGGFNCGGRGWNRDDDNIGIGYAYLDGGNRNIDSSQIVEAYYRAALNEYLALTADVQYMRDDLSTRVLGQEDPQGWLFGLRLVAEF